MMIDDGVIGNPNLAVVTIDEGNIYSDKDADDDADVVCEYDEQKANELREQTKKLVQVSDSSKVTMAGYLYEIRRNKLFKNWGYDKFRDYVETELAIGIRTAEYLLQIWHQLVEVLGGGRTHILDKVKHLGITKMKECLNLITADNVDSVIDQMRDLSVRRVAEIKKEIAISEHLHKKDGDPDDEADDLGSVHQRMSFKLYPDQFKSVNDALVLAGKIGSTECKNTQLRYMAEEFLSSYQNHDDPLSSKTEACLRFEKTHGVFLLVASASDGKILYGADLEERLDKLVKDYNDGEITDKPPEE